METELPKTQTTHQQTHAEDAVRDDDDRRKHRVTSHDRGVRGVVGHHRNDQADLDDRHRERKHDRAKCGSDAFGDHLGMVHRVGDRDGQHQHRKNRPWRRVAPEAAMAHSATTDSSDETWLASMAAKCATLKL
ncbi:MAG TPA: hypothetical protein VI197_04480 [Polyangiaceae bacterium]